MFLFGGKPWDITGKVAVVTGAGGAIGREIAIILRRDYNCHLALCDNDESRLTTTLACVTFFDQHNSLVSLRTTTHVVDVANREAVFAFAEDVRNVHGRCEIVFNNAGVAFSAAFDQVDLADLDKVMNINLGGVINIAKAFLPLLKENERAALVNTSSIMGLTSFIASTAYCMAKYGITALSQNLAMESSRWYPQVLICSAHPGFIRTNIIANSKQFIHDIKGEATIDLSKVDKYFQHLGSTTPQQVAYEMVEGMRYGKQRILIGTDAVILDIVARLFPGFIYMPRAYLAFFITLLIGVRFIGRRTVAALFLILYYYQSARINAFASRIKKLITGLTNY